MGVEDGRGKQWVAWLAEEKLPALAMVRGEMGKAKTMMTLTVGSVQTQKTEPNQTKLKK
jgi:hypothetical protein